MITHTIDSNHIPSPKKWKECKQNCRFFFKVVYGNNRSRTENVTEWSRFSKSRSNGLEDIGQGQRSKVITCNTPSHASDHLYQIWKESIQNCRCYRADKIFKVKAEWPWKYRSRSKVITCDTFSDANDDLCQIWKECKQNCSFFKVKAEKLEN